MADAVQTTSELQREVCSPAVAEQDYRRAGSDGRLKFAQHSLDVRRRRFPKTRFPARQVGNQKVDIVRQ